MEYQTKIRQLLSIGFTELEIGELVGVSQPTVSRIKNGQKEWPDGLVCRKIDELVKSNIRKINKVAKA